MRDVLFAIAFLLLGGFLGIYGLVRWWYHHLQNTGHLRSFLLGVLSNPRAFDLLQELNKDKPTCAMCGQATLDAVPIPESEAVS